MSDLTNNHLRGKSRADQNYLFELRTLPRMHSAIKRDIKRPPQTNRRQDTLNNVDGAWKRRDSESSHQQIKDERPRPTAFSMSRTSAMPLNATSAMQIKKSKRAKRIKIRKEES